jgi:flagellar hook-length control protein FliK
LPQVASDPVVSRPQRPESSSGRAGAPAGEPSGAFEGLLDTAPAAQRSRPERATRSRPSDQARPADRRLERAPEASPTAKSTGKTKPADTPHAPAARNGQSADPGETVAKAAETVAEATPVPPVDFAAVAEALTGEAAADAKPVEQTTDDAPVTQSKASDDAAVLLAPNATVAPPPAAAIAVVLPAPLPATSPTAAVNSEVGGIAPVELQAAPAIPPVAANPEPPALPSLSAETSEPAAANAHVAAAAAATTASVEKIAPPDDAQKAAALKGLPETVDAKDATAAPADRKTESGKAKSDHPGLAARTPDTQPHLSATKSATDAAPEQQPKAAQHPPRPEAAERASLTAHAGAADARPEIPVTAAPQAQIQSAGPLPFGLAIHAAIPLAALSPLTALRIEAPADNAVPVAGLAVEIVSRAQDGLRRFDIRLDPPELGRIDVRLDVDTAGKVTSRLTVERAETLDLLRRDAPQLERALQHAGLNTEGGLEFSLRDQNFANREQAPRNPAATQLIVPDDEAAAAEAARRGYGRMIGLGGGVDIRV